jgi:hypothetical protein
MMQNNRICLQKWKDGVVVERNPDDGFVDATQMCEKFNKKFYEYSRGIGSAYIHALQTALGESLPVINTIRGHGGKTWVHPRLAIDFARWLSADFAVWLDGWILKIVDVVDVVTVQQEEQLITESTHRLFLNQLVIMSETDLHFAVVTEVRKTWPSAVLVPGIGELPEAGDKRLKAWRMGYTKGQPDLMIANPNHDHTGLAVEFKHPGFEPTPSTEQLSFHAQLRALGWKVIVCNNYTHGIREIDAYMKTCKIICECCTRLFPSKKHIESHMLRKRKYETEEDAVIAEDN